MKSINDVSNAEIKIFNTQGQLVFKKNKNAIKEIEPLQIDVSTMHKGIYLLQIFSEGSVIAKKFVKE